MGFQISDEGWLVCAMSLIQKLLSSDGICLTVPPPMKGFTNFGDWNLINLALIQLACFIA